MKVRFLPDGGFHKSGAFIEYIGAAPTGNEPQFEHLTYSRISLSCTDVRLVTSAAVSRGRTLDDQADAAPTRWLVATGHIEAARWGRFSLTFLGKEKLYHKVSVTIHESNSGENAEFSALQHEADIDLPGWDEFFVEVHITAKKFSKVLSEIEKGDAKLELRVAAAKFEGFYATWSPSISEGREIKFLSNIKAVENGSEIPAEFLSRKKDNASGIPVTTQPVDIFVSRSVLGLAETYKGPQSNRSDDDDNYDKYDSNNEFDDGVETLKNASRKADFASERIRADQVAYVSAITRQIKRSGFLISAAIGVLTVVSLFF